MRTHFAVALAICGALLSTSLAAQSPSTDAAQTQATSKPALNLNTATVEQLEALPGIGRKTAERILEYRTKSGGFKRIEELMNVKGIGEKSFLKLKPLIAVPAKTDKATGE
jgi:competence protein ComEA